MAGEERSQNAEARDSLDEELSVAGEEADRAAIMEEFELLEDGDGAPRGNVILRASQASQRFARKFNTRIIYPVQKVLIDPVVKLWRNAEAALDAFLGRYGNPLMFKRLLYLLVVAIILFVAITIGLVRVSTDDLIFNGKFHDHEEIRRQIFEQISSEALRERIEYMSSMPHSAGTAGDMTLAEYVQESLTSYGLKPVSINEFAMFLSFPNKTDDSSVLELWQNDEMKYKADLSEGQVYEHPEQSQKQPKPLLSLAAAGEHRGRLVYANYGTKDDFAFLEEQGIDVHGAVVLMKYGKAVPGMKVHLAEERGAAGVVFFSEKLKDTGMWPDGPDRPEDAVQRGDLGMFGLYPGDILTPGWPSGVSRQLDYSKVHTIPKIPAIALSWKDVKPLLESLKGHGTDASGHEDWGKNLQPQLDEWWTGGSDDGPEAYIKSSPAMVERHSVWNVMSKIDGIEQYEKGIIIGAQRDSYCFGTSDSVSGTAILLEIARALSLVHHNHGWSPLRTIYFASWDGTLQNLAGATEWCEYNVDELRRNGVAYFDIGKAISGAKLRARGHPVFESMLREILTIVNTPGSNTTTLLEAQSEQYRGVESFSAIEQGNYIPFVAHAGLVSLSLSFESDDGVTARDTCYDTFEWMTKFGDSTFGYHTALAQALSLLLLKYSDNPVIPFDVANYGTKIHAYVNDLRRYADTVESEGSSKLDLRGLTTAADTIIQGSTLLEGFRQKWMFSVGDVEPPILSNFRLAWNERLVDLDKHMLDRNGQPERNWYKHGLFGPQLWPPSDTSFESFTFPGIRDAIEAKDWDQASALVERWGNILLTAARKLIE